MFLKEFLEILGFVLDGAWPGYFFVGRLSGPVNSGALSTISMQNEQWGVN